MTDTDGEYEEGECVCVR